MNWIKLEIALPATSMKAKWKYEDGTEDVGFYNNDIKEFMNYDPKELDIIYWKPLMPPLE